MKKLLCIVLALSTLATMLVFGITVNAAEVGKVEAGYTPTGTAINSAADFATMTADGSYYLNADITIDATWNGGAALSTTASGNTAFTGTFDGNGHKITTTAPLFAILSGTVKNLTVDGSITSTTVGDGSGVNYSAAIAYYAKGNIVLENVANNANISGASLGAGFIAYVNTYSTGTLNVKNCVNNGNISTVNSDTTDAAAGTHKLGGLVAFITGGTGTFENCVNNGVLSATGGGKYGYFGGIVGQIGRTSGTLPNHTTCNFTIKNCTNNANITADAMHCAGIVAFLCGHLEILDTTNNGDITNIKATGSRAAGIFGATGSTDYQNSLVIDGCVNNGTVKGSYHAAGIASYLGDGLAEDGANGWTYTLRNSANYGNVYLDGENVSASYRRVGGLVAYAAGGTYNGVENCVNMGDVYINLDYTTSNNPHVSALIGYVNNKNFTIKNNINAGNLILGGLETSTVKPTASMIAYNNQASLTANTANNYSLPAVEGSIFFRLKEGASLEDEAKAKAVTAEQIASGEAVWTLNEAAGATIFYQDLATGKITLTAAEDGSNVVIKNADGSYSNYVADDGTPKPITSADDFANMKTDGNYYLDADITISASYPVTFTGTLDGKGKTITTTAPLFTNLAGTVKDVTVNGTIAETTEHNAIIAVQGSGDITFENVHTTGTVAGGNKVAAFLAYGADGTNVTLKNCVNDAEVKSTGTTTADKTKAFAAGFVACIDGLTNFSAENCTNNGNITSDTAYGAGIATVIGSDSLAAATAATLQCTVKNCTNNGKITGNAGYSSGIVSYSLGVITIENCVNTGDVENKTASSAGILGSVGAGDYKSAASIKNCENHGKLTAAMKVAGISVYFGRNMPMTDSMNSIENCANYGDIYLNAAGTVPADGSMAAGIIARNYMSSTQTHVNVLKNCLNAGDIYVDMTNSTAPNKTSIGGIAAYMIQAGHIVANNINIGNISITNRDGIVYASSTINHRNSSKSPTAISNNYGLAIENITLADTQIDFTFTDAMIKAVTSEQVASGELVYMLNEAAGETIFYQDLANNGQPTLTAAEDGSNVVIKNADGSYSNPVVEGDGDDDGDVTTAPGGDVTTVPGGDVTTVPGGDVTTVPSGDVTTVPSGDTTTTVPSDNDTTTEIPVDNNTTKAPDDNTTKAPDSTTAKPAEKKSCGGVSLVTVLASVVTAVAAAVVLGKKKF